MLKKIIICCLLAGLAAPATAKMFSCQSEKIKYRDIFRLIQREPSGKNYDRLINFMTRCSRWGAPRLVLQAPNKTRTCQSGLGGYYSYADHSITICLRRGYQHKEVRAIIIHELVHALRVRLDTSRFWKIWARREKNRALDSYHSVPPANRPPNLLQDELLAYNVQEYAEAVYNNDHRRQTRYSAAEKALFEYILNGKYQ